MSVRAREVISLTSCRWNVGGLRAGTCVGQLEVAPEERTLPSPQAEVDHDQRVVLRPWSLVLSLVVMTRCGQRWAYGVARAMRSATPSPP